MRIHLFTTGRTIDKTYFDALSEYHIGESEIARLLHVAKVILPIGVTEPLSKDSLELDDNDCLLIQTAVAAAPAERVVVTHGTDTMTETAKVLSGILGKTIVLVGALAPARFVESDASFNLGMAVATAQIAQPGIYITRNGIVFDAERVHKDRDLGAFVSK